MEIAELLKEAGAERREEGRRLMTEPRYFITELNDGIQWLTDGQDFGMRAAAVPALLEALKRLEAHVPDREGLQPVDAEVKAFLNHVGLWQAKELARQAIQEAS